MEPIKLAGIDQLYMWLDISLALIIASADGICPVYLSFRPFSHSFLEYPLVWVFEPTGFLCLSDSSIHKMANSWVLEQREIKEKIDTFIWRSREVSSLSLSLSLSHTHTHTHTLLVVMERSENGKEVISIPLPLQCQLQKQNCLTEPWEAP